MKRALVTALAVVISITAFAAPKDKTPTTIKCAVMGDKVSVANATKNHMYADYKGRRYFFCCGACPSAFKANPAKYAKAQSIPTPKPSRSKHA